MAISNPAIEVDLVVREGLHIAHNLVEHVVDLRLLDSHMVNASEWSDVPECHQIGLALVLDDCYSIISV